MVATHTARASRAHVAATEIKLPLWVCALVATACLPSPPSTRRHLSNGHHSHVMDLKLPTPKTFEAFPFLPYEIQLQLMKHLYGAIESSQVTIVESPTGTVRGNTRVISTLELMML